MPFVFFTSPQSFSRVQTCVMHKFFHALSILPFIRYKPSNYHEDGWAVNAKPNTYILMAYFVLVDTVLRAYKRLFKKWYTCTKTCSFLLKPKTTKSSQKDKIRPKPISDKKVMLKMNTFSILFSSESFWMCIKLMYSNTFCYSCNGF